MSTDNEEPLFGAVHRRLFRATTFMFCLVALLALLGLVLWLLGRGVALFYNLILPLSIAGILALVLDPVVDYLEHRLHMKRLAAVSLILLVFAVILAGTIFLLLPAVAQQLVEFGKLVPDIVAGWQDSLSRRFPGVTAAIAARAEEGDFDGILPHLGNLGEMVRASIGVVVGLGFVPLFLFFALLSGEGIRGKAAELLSIFSTPTQQKLLYFMDVFVGQMTAFFQGQLIIALIMGIMFAVGLTAIGLKVGILVGLVLGMLSIVPYLGSLVGLLIVIPLAYFQPGGGVPLIGFSLVVFALVQLAEGLLLTPKIMADRTGLHPALVVIAIFFWGTALGGILGMILAVPLTAFLVAIWSQVKRGLTQSMSPDDSTVEIKIYQSTGTEAALQDIEDDTPLLEK